MIDLDFINNPRPNLKKIALYSYTTGAFKNSFLQKIFSLRPETQKVNYSTFLQETKAGSLFGNREFYLEIQDEKELKEIYPLCKNTEDKIVIVVPFPAPEYLEKEIVKQEFFESEKTKNIFKSAFQYICLQTGVTEQQMQDNPLLEQNLLDLYAKSESLQDFIQRAEFSLHLCMEEGKWNSLLFRSTLPIPEPKKYYILQEKLYFLITTPSPGSKELMFQYLEQQYNSGQDSRQIVNAIYRAFFDLCENNQYIGVNKDDFKSKMLTKYTYIEVGKLMKALFKLCEHETALNRDNFLISAENMLQEMVEYLQCQQ